eukprot:9204477-Lingulodinium_polyedra.AAC.1
MGPNWAIPCAVGDPTERPGGEDHGGWRCETCWYSPTNIVWTDGPARLTARLPPGWQGHGWHATGGQGQRRQARPGACPQPLGTTLEPYVPDVARAQAEATRRAGAGT